MVLAKRIIPCLDVKGGRAVKGVNFQNLKDVGIPAQLGKHYCAELADELCFLDIDATLENRKTVLGWVREVAEEIDIPFCVGGGVSTVWDFTALMRNGADKVCINSGALANPQLISQCAREYGSQAVVVAADYKRIAGKKGTEKKVFSKAGSEETVWDAASWAKKAEELVAGELLLTSIDADGTKNGFDVATLAEISNSVSIPIIASGGAGKIEDFAEVFNKTACTGALAAGIFHRVEVSIYQVKRFLQDEGVTVRL